MDIPYIVIDQLTPDQQQLWKTYFGDADRPLLHRGRHLAPYAGEGHG